jgi:hypothetical protein
MKLTFMQISGLPIKRFLVYLNMCALLHSLYSNKFEDDCRWWIGKDMEKIAGTRKTIKNLSG